MAAAHSRSSLRLMLTADIAELSPGGEGVAICTIDEERRAVFVPGVVSGERVKLDVDPSTRPARARLLEVITPSASRVSPLPCAWAVPCGGCDWMHLEPKEQQVEHARIVSRLLNLSSLHSPIEIVMHEAPRTVGYRTRARVHIQAPSTKRQRAPGFSRVIVGMFARRSHEPTEVDTCIVLDPILDRVRGSLASWLEGASGEGEAQLALGADRRGVLDLHWKKGLPLPGAVFGRLERAVNEGALAGARVFGGDVRVPAKIGDPTPIVAGADGEPLRLAPGGFSQASDECSVLLARRVAELARAAASLDTNRGPPSCVELYSGAGNLTVLLARDRDSIVAVERDKEACAAARANLTARGLSTSSARVVAEDAATFAIPKNTSLVVLDPPREGARAVAESLASARGSRKPETIIYVACDPPTLARDVKILTEGGAYAITRVETFEMFPQTSHVETVVVLSSSSSKAPVKQPS